MLEGAMNVREGARRMRKAGRMLILAPLVVLVILNIVWIVEYFLVRNDLRSAMGLIPICIPFMVPGAALWLAGWMVDGFAKDGLKDNQLEH
jgi:hypothetical protein